MTRLRLRPVVVCAPNAFRGSLGAVAAASALAAGVLDGGGRPLLAPMADGGDGSLEVLLAAAPGSTVRRLRVSGPLGGRALARLGWIDPHTAVVELAQAAGLVRCRGARRPLDATSRGVGELITAALDAGAQRILVGIGGSACTDGGSGLLTALGARLLDGRGRPLRPGGGALAGLRRADLTGLAPRLRGVRLEIAADVTNPLLGGRGAAAVYAPQKGADPAGVERLEAGLETLAAVLERDAGIPPSLRELAGAGAAGGCGYGLAAIGAVLLPGAALVADAIGLDQAIAGSDLVITGEGTLDHQTAAGKAPFEVARRAARLGVPCAAVAGVVRALPQGFAAAVSLSEVARPGEDPRRMPRRLLRRAAAMLTRSA